MSRFRDLARAPARGRPGLTSLIDVVFILLLFFMLATRFTLEGRMELSAGRLGESAQASDRPSALLRVLADRVDLGGLPLDEPALAAALRELAEAGTPLIVEPREGTSLQRLVDVLDLVDRAGLPSVTVAGR